MSIKASDTLAVRMIRQTLNRANGVDLTDQDKFAVFSSLLSAAASIENEMLRISVLRYVDSRLSKLKAAS